MIRQRMARPALLAALAALLEDIAAPHPLRVAIDGIDAAGKTTLADDLAHLIQQRSRPAIRASVDGFHNPRTVRARCGSLDPAGYYYDAFDYAALVRDMLLPLGPGGRREYRAEVFDYRADQPIDAPPQHAPPDAILIVDGVFLLRPELRPYWDATIFLDIPFDLALARALTRDLELFGSAEAIHERYMRRYLPGQRLYFEQCRPREQADIVVENADPAAPALMLRYCTAARYT